MSTASEWAAAILGGAQFAAGIGIAYYTLRKQHAENIAQREGDWFHLVVADKTIDALHLLVETESNALLTSAERCVKMKTGQHHQSTIDAAFTKEIQDFRARIKPTRQRIKNFAYIFDLDLYKEVSQRFEDLEDKVAEWFDKLQRDGPVERRESLMDIVCQCQRELLSSFRTFEFATLPNRQRQATKGSRPWKTLTLGAVLLCFAAFVRLAGASFQFQFAGKTHSLRLDETLFWVTLIIGIACATAAITRWNASPKS